MKLAFTTGLLCLAGIAASAQAAPVKIGLIETLSGPQASTGLIFRAAVKYQLDRINAAGGWNGQPLELVEFDNQGAPGGRVRPLPRGRRRGRADPGAGFVRDLRPADRRRAQSTTCAIRARKCCS